MTTTSVQNKAQNNNPVVTIDDGGDHWLVTIDNPPVNATSTAVRAGLMMAIDHCIDDGKKKAVILFCKGRSFIAGGDISEFGAPPQEPHLPDICNAIEQSSLPWIALMHGHVLGGGFEIAMAASYRLADSRTKFGMTEVKLGLIPGAGGSQRLPRLIGLDAAIPMLTTGTLITASELHGLGGLDHILSDDAPNNTSSDTTSTTRPAHHGLAFAKAFLQSLPPRPMPVSQRDITINDAALMATTEAKLKKASRGEQAALENLAAVQIALDTDFADGQPRERERHLILRDSTESRALRHAFLSERLVSKPSLINNTKPQPIKNITVVGGGLMGAGISFSALMAGYHVTLIEQNDDAIDGARTRINSMMDGALKRGKITADQSAQRIDALTLTSDYHDAASADLVIEAVFEDLDVKKRVFEKLATIVRADTILATNTSYLDPHHIMDGVSNPERTLGLHFFSPAHIMKLVEVITLNQTDKNVVAAGFAFAKSLGKTGVLSRVCDGFIGNRILAAYRRQADYLLMDGAMPAQIDRAMRDFGFNMGPYEMQDMAGLQISWANRKRQAATRPAAERYVSIGDALCEREWFGQRSGKGWYRYDDGNRTPLPNDDVETLILAHAADAGITRRQFTDEDIQMRLMAVMANEGALLVSEGIAERDLDIDMVKLLGYGFPRWRGGPMCLAGAIGWDHMTKIMADVVAQSPNSWTVAERLRP